MTSEEPADIRRPGKEASNVSRADESKEEKKPNVPFKLGVTEENDDLTGRAYKYFHKLQ